MGPLRSGMWDGPASGAEGRLGGLPAHYLGADQAPGVEARMGLLPPAAGAGGVGLPPRYLGTDEVQVMQPSTLNFF